MYETFPLDRPHFFPYTMFCTKQRDDQPRREPWAGAHSCDPNEEVERLLKEFGVIGSDPDSQQTALHPA